MQNQFCIIDMINLCEIHHQKVAIAHGRRDSSFTPVFPDCQHFYLIITQNIFTYCKANFQVILTGKSNNGLPLLDNETRDC